MTEAEKLVSLARETGAMIATAESCTGGLVAGAITDVPGSSHVFDRGFVTYSNTAKTRMLGVDPALIEAHGAVSEEVARAMAEGALANSDATVAISLTGIAGPGGSHHKPEGRVCFGLAHKDNPTATETVEFGALGRTEVRRAAVLHALALLKQALS
ncbi:MAG: CinA family protein [Rhodobacteraceae bacterium]|nr:CinA family protein [Paracoccaceae bacterium]